ncbi:Stk1 family PASTA domain-containing Ser/Thr kinase [Demequina capsici]|uniref:non-specific serine/threonine protein kinase n=1 Tax=Demequina capsici TaxID=3075620 RepID=A0AA96FAE6_9MICO|nr:MULTISPECIES: Stk1 family PASTA domain-containing Ser/Thr kinase [unclassified Demequina]WNM25690.1 Stk1 family PASTA domain-containing Ser/Thr kinase [Demequina sp. OYTSA14]WNM28585.1 Stk1 family PASTA domain-containing Ser/Thr kinase [Demequina sp. PMTSA13]
MSETLTDPLLGRLIDGRYEVRARVAAGGMATVYVAFDRRLEREVAIKVMSPRLGEDADSARFASRFRREARAAARLTHPGMVRVYDQGVDGDISYLTMEYVEGENLRARIAHERTLTVGEALAIGDQVLDALAAAHRLGLVHRDIKPENVLLDSDGRPKVADFGLSRAIEDSTAGATSAGVIMGTVAYLGPELVSHGTADASTDVYAVGILLFEMLTGRQPFVGGSPIEVATQHVHGDMPSPSAFVPWLPAEIDALVQRMTARDPKDRPTDAAAALVELREVRATLDDPTLDRRATPPSGAIPIDTDDPDATTVLDAVPQGTTVVLPVGLATLQDEPPVEAEIVDEATALVTPDRGRTRPAVWIGALAAAVAVLALLGVWWYNAIGPGAYSVVPDVTGQTEAAATDTLETAGYTVLPSQTDYSDSVDAGLVISTSPEAEARVLNGSEITLTISAGPQMATVPDVVGTAQDDAVGAVTDAGFGSPAIAQQYSDTVASGTVLSVSPDQGQEVRHDTAVTLTVSQGPEPITVPNVSGMTEDDAVATLQNDYAMTVTVQYDRTDKVDKGIVYAQTPAAGADGFRTGAITITVSDGLPLVEVPDFINMKAKAAQQAADDANIVVQYSPRFFSFITGDLKNDSVIVDQNVAPGTQVEQGSTVYLIYDN